MFDIGFWEIALISIVGLVVLGPERLPTAIRSVMQWINTAKGMANAVKTEITEELKLHELNEMNENMIKASKDGIENLDSDLQESINEMKKSAQELVQPYKSEKPPESDDLDKTLTEESQRDDKVAEVKNEKIEQGKKIDE